MADQVSSDVKLEIGHVLFIDIVGYSKLLINEQSERLQKLKEIVWGTEQFRQAQAEGKLLRLPIGKSTFYSLRKDAVSEGRAYETDRQWCHHKPGLNTNSVYACCSDGGYTISRRS
jgi:hypothetical protein